MIAVKPHHFVDIVTALGDERVEFLPHSYGHAVHTVAQDILANRDIALRIESALTIFVFPAATISRDSAMTPLTPHSGRRHPRRKREYNLLIDRRWAERLGVRQNDELTARELCSRIRDCVNDIADIYWETPAERTAARQAKLQKGIALFLNEP